MLFVGIINFSGNESLDNISVIALYLNVLNLFFSICNLSDYV